MAANGAVIADNNGYRYNVTVSIMQSVIVLLACLNFVGTLQDVSRVRETPIYEVDCSTLRMGQYLCPHPKYEHIDPKTQELKNCQKNNKAKVLCLAVEGLVCAESKNSTFYLEMPCKWTNGYSFETTMILSVFLGMFGADRFYLGYPAIGLAKFCTLGFMFIGQLIDIVLIATQYVGPADGSAYVIPYFGPHVEVVRSDNMTFRIKQDDW